MNKLFLLCFFICITKVSAQDGDRLDGNYWNNLDKTNKYFYLKGYFDGINLGYKLSIWGVDSSKIDCALEVVNSFNEHTSNYLQHVTGTQMLDGLDEFYKDYRNRNIMIKDSIWLILNSIAGKSEQEMQLMIETYRENAK